MVDFRKEKNYVGNYKFIITTNEGEFEISKEENDCLYIGFYNPNETKDEVTFQITDENEQLYKIIEKLVRSFKEANNLIDILKDTDNEVTIKAIRRDNPFDGEKVVWYSDDFRIDEASKLIITESNEENAYNFTFVKSKSKKEGNTYFVSIWGKESHHSLFSYSFKAFYQNLLISSHVKEDLNKTQRVR